MQKAISVNTVVGGPIASLQLEELNQLLASGWTINQTIAACIGPILVILDEPKPAEANAAQ